MAPNAGVGSEESESNGMNKELEELLERSKAIVMTPEQREEQRRSFAYGNAKISNPNVTREMVDRAAEEMQKTSADGKR